MELAYPWVLLIGTVVLILLIVLRFINNTKYKNGKKVANTSLVEETELYKKLKKRYKIWSNSAIVCLLIAIGIGFVAVSRPSKVETIDTKLRNRDIFLCMDISTSVDELNIQMCDKLIEVVKELNGERFGITIFNAKSVLLVPLTSDYEYVVETLEQLKASFDISINGTDNDDLDNYYENLETSVYRYEGTLSTEGSSYIGDGLASCLYSFPDLEDNSERSRLIIFTTDNELNGVPYVSLEEAASLCKKNDVKVFAIAPDNIVDESIFKSSMESTGGEYYRFTSEDTFDQLIGDISETDTSEMFKTEVRIYDKPEVVFICMIIFIGAYFVIGRKVKL